MRVAQQLATAISRLAARSELRLATRVRLLAASVPLVIAVSLASACEAGHSDPTSAAPTAGTVAREVARVFDADGARAKVDRDGAALVAKFECARCHEVPGSPPVAPEKQCFGCHQRIHAGTFTPKHIPVSVWQQRITSLRYAPSLVAADRLRRVWVQQFLLHPHDLRPGSIAEMPRLAITADQAARLATFLVPREDAMPIDTSDMLVARGEHLFGVYACGRCHRFTGSVVDDPMLHVAGREPRALEAWTLAPDLRHARKRLQPTQVAAWIQSPRGVMPNLSIDEQDARALAAFVLATPITVTTRLALPRRLPLLERPVRWAEVSKQVFHDQCWHCHAVADYARGDGGPGNTGGFGFEARGLDLSSYEGISQGVIGDDGERHSVFERLSDGTPRIVAHMLARYVEESGGSIDGVPGMPLGLPPLSLDKIQLVESWIAQGRPQ